MDAVHFHVRQDKQTVKKAVYVAIGVKLDGVKEVLGMRIGGNEGFVDAIGAVFPKAEIQRYIVHQIRYTTKFVSYVVSYQHLKMLILGRDKRVYFAPLDRTMRLLTFFGQCAIIFCGF